MKTINIAYTTARRRLIQPALALLIFITLPERMAGNTEDACPNSYKRATLYSESTYPSATTVGAALPVTTIGEILSAATADETLPSASFLVGSERNVLRAGGTEEEENGGNANKLVDGVPVGDYLYPFLLWILGYGLYLRRYRPVGVNRKSV